jgi:hypothetical protein
MKNKSTQTILILMLAFLFFTVIAFVVSNSSLAESTWPTPWQPASLATDTPTLLPTGGWWRKLQTPNPIRTLTPKNEGNP